MVNTDTDKAIADSIAQADFPEVYMTGNSNGNISDTMLDSTAINQMLDIVTKMNQ